MLNVKNDKKREQNGQISPNDKYDLIIFQRYYGSIKQGEIEKSLLVLPSLRNHSQSCYLLGDS